MRNYLIRNGEKLIIFNPETYDIHVCHNEEAEATLMEDSPTDAKMVCPQAEYCGVLDIQAANICMCETCNLACSYCFFHSGTFDKTGGKMISLETLIKTYEKLAANSQSGLKSIGFYGGEPLLNFAVIRDFVNYLKAHVDYSISFGVITNGTLLTQEMVEFFNENRFYVSISLDGTKKYNDMCRISKNGKSVFDTVMEKLKLLKNKRFLLSSQSTLSNCFFREYQKGTINSYFDTFYSAGFDNIIPVTADLKEGYTEDEIDRMTAFFEDVVDYSFEALLHDETKYYPPVFVAKMIRNLAAKRYEGECQAGSKYVFVTVDGDIFPCQMHYMCDVAQMNHGCEITAIKRRVSRCEIAECQECFSKNICAMWCPGGSLVLNGAEDSVIPARCVAQKALLKEIIIKLVEFRNNKDKWDVFVKNLVDFSNHYSVAEYLDGC